MEEKEKQEDKKSKRTNNTSLAGQQIVTRFFIAIHELKNRRRIKGVQTFTNKYGINRGTFWTIESNPQRKSFDVGWLNYLVKDYNVNPDWLLTGKGSMFNEDSSTVKKA